MIANYNDQIQLKRRIALETGQPVRRRLEDAHDCGHDRTHGYVHHHRRSGARSLPHLSAPAVTTPVVKVQGLGGRVLITKAADTRRVKEDAALSRRMIPQRR